jgi:hypothetical protein
MPIALDPDRTVEYVLKAERESDDATVFYLRALSLRERAEVEDAAFTLHGEEVLMKNATRRLALLARGLTGWGNFVDKKRQAVVFEKDSRGRADDASLNRLDDETVVELAQVIADLSQVSEADQD